MSEMSGISTRKIGAACGLLGSVLFFVLYYEAIRLDPSYVFGKDYLSDLGVSPGAWAFNSGVMATGALEIAFAVLAWYPSIGRGPLQRISAVLLVLAGTLLISMGILTEDFDPEHLIVSVSFFITMLVFLGVSTLAQWKARPLGALGVAVTGASFLLGLALLPIGFVPSTETVAVFAINAWGLVTASLILTKNETA